MKVKTEKVEGLKGWSVEAERGAKLQASKLQPSIEIPTVNFQIRNAPGWGPALRFGVQFSPTRSKQVKAVEPLQSDLVKASPTAISRAFGALTAQCECMRVDPSAYDHFFTFMKVNDEHWDLGAARIFWCANVLGRRWYPWLFIIESDSAPVNPSESDQIRPVLDFFAGGFHGQS